MSLLLNFHVRIGWNIIVETLSISTNWFIWKAIYLERYHMNSSITNSLLQQKYSNQNNYQELWFFYGNVFKNIESLLVLSLPSCVRCSCDPMDWSLPGSSVRGISQARILEWVAILFSSGPSPPRKWTHVSCNAGNSLPLRHQGQPWSMLRSMNADP